MSSISDIKNILVTDKSKKYLQNIYLVDDREYHRTHNRFLGLLDLFMEKYGEQEVKLFSTPGRTEIGGNHTDHNHGRVLAGSVNLDSLAVVSTTAEYVVTIHSNGFDTPFVVDLSKLERIIEEDGTTNSIIRGIAARFVELGYKIGGFKAVINSNVLVGSGLSSSASIEVLIGTILNHFYNEDKIDPVTIASIGQYAENNYFGKPCGLMDQVACAVGGIVEIDFSDPANPKVEKVEFDFSSAGYNLLVVDTGGNHADLTEDYSSIPSEMKMVANALGQAVCRKLTFNDVLLKVKELRTKVGDRAILRAFHFITDNQRVEEQASALKKNDISSFLNLINESGDSSFMYLQNCYTTKNVNQQGIALALAISRNYIKDVGEGACRVHGGGFAGTIQAFLPSGTVNDYKQLLESVFGEGSVLKLSVRNMGSTVLEL